MLEAINLGCVRGDRRLFRGLNFSVSAGELVEIRGPNGGGKTSLLRILCGLSAPAEGDVRWQSTPIKKLGEHYSGSIAYLAHQNGIKDEFTAIENLRLSCATRGTSMDLQSARTIIERLGLRRQQNLATRLLSAGQRRRLALARLVAADAQLWILDEALSSLDRAGEVLAQDLMAEHLKNGRMTVIATHQDLNISAGLMKRIDLAS